MVKRFEDMGDGVLKVVKHDGDVTLCIETRCSISEKFCVASIEFTNPSSGGGVSKHTHEALKNLMEAIEKDNQERPQNLLKQVR